MNKVKPRMMKQRRNSAGRYVAWLALWMMIVSPVFAAETVYLEKANFVALPGDKIELRFDFNGAPPVPKAYLIDTPSRLIVDLWQVESRLSARSLDVKTGQVDSIRFAQTDGRLRLVANLYQKSGYESFIEGNSLFLVISEEEKVKTTANSKVERVVAQSERDQLSPTYQQAESRVTGIDFERLDGNVGRVSVTLSDDSAMIDIQEESGNVVVNLIGAGLSNSLSKRIDVQDFATPVMYVDSLSSGANSTIMVRPGSGEYDYMAYQTGNQLILDFKPKGLNEQPEDQRQVVFTGEAIDLNFQDVDLRSVLQIIAEVAELNLVVSDAVTGNITLRLKNVPWDQSLDIILKTKQLDKRIVGNVLLVAPAAEIAEREAQELESSKKVEELAPLRTEFVQVDFRKASDMMTRLQEAKLVSERGFIVADDETNVLMVRETGSAIDEIRRTLRQFDVEVEQVVIEARLVTASTKVTKDLGIKWGFGFQDIDGGVILNDSLENISFSPPSSTIGSMVDFGVSGSSFAIGIKPGASSLLALELTALETDGKAEVISQPKIMTTNGKLARIESGSEIPYQTVENGEVSISFKSVSLSLEVTPRINPGNRISLELVVHQDSLGEVLPNGDISIVKNELNTSVVVPDGQTVVLGGVFKKETSDAVAKTPFLGDLPILGSLFRKTETSGDKSELLIFITPKLVRESLTIK